MDEEQKNPPEQVSQVEGQTPDEKKDRTTEQFEKLKQSNQELKAERDAALEENKQYQSVMDSLIPDPSTIPNSAQRYQSPINQAPPAQSFSNLNQQQVNQAFQSMVDENGYLDGQKLMQTLQQMDQRARQAELRAQQVEQQVRQREQQEQENRKTQATQALHEKYPMLDPENKEQFNPDFWEAVRNDLIGQMMQGKEDPMVAAEKWYHKFYEDGDDVTKKEKAQQLENQKKQINATRPRSPLNVGYYAQEEEGALISQVRQGRKGAVAELLKRRGL